MADPLVDYHSLQARENEERLKSILECILFCDK